jgi:hypothetical protein
VDLDARRLKAEDRLTQGLPPDFNGEMTYGYERHGDDLVLVPLWQLRTYTPVSFKRMAV